MRPCHEGRKHWQELVNVGFSVFHEGRGAGKSATHGGHIIVSEKNSYEKKKSYDSNVAVPADSSNPRKVEEGFDSRLIRLTGVR